MKDSKILSLLEELLFSAQIGRNYASDIHNQKRYDDILEKTRMLYELVPGFKQQYFPAIDTIGYVTPKIGVNAILENEKGEILLEKRVDDQSWCIIGGWCEVGLTPEENIIKEVKEETGFDAEIIKLDKIWARVANEYYPFSSYHIVYHCKIIGGTLEVSHESEDVAFWDFNQVDNWHLDHRNWVAEFLGL